MKLEQYALQYTGSASQKKAIAYLEQWLAKWRSKEWLAFVQLYRNNSTDAGKGFSLANAMQYFAVKSYQKQAFAMLDLLLEAYDNGSIAKAFAVQWKESRPINHFVQFNQMDSAYIDYRTSSCNVSACASMLSFNGISIKNDDDLLKHFINAGIKTTDHGAMTSMLKKHYSFDSNFVYNATFADLDAAIARNEGSVVGILHRGTIYAPSGSGHMIFVYAKQGDSYKVADPYGSLLDADGAYTGPVSNGVGVLYPASELKARWTVEGNGSGWARFKS